MILLVGLGNPGTEYARTRHNCGFMVADALAAAFGVTFGSDSKFKAEVGEFHEGGTKVCLAKPGTFMNLSGDAVGAIARFYKIEPKRIWVITDDLDLPLGKIRVRHGGESGGHHGLESIQDALQSQDFSRIRLGIRGAEIRQEHLDNNIDTNSFVTGPFGVNEQAGLDRTLALAVQIIREALQSGELKAHTYEADGMDDRTARQ